MGSTAGQYSSMGNTNTGKTHPPTSSYKHRHTYTGMFAPMYTHTNPEQTMGERQGDLGAPHAVMTNSEHGNLWRETFNRSVPRWEAPAAIARAVPPASDFLLHGCKSNQQPFTPTADGLIGLFIFFQIKFFSHNNASSCLKYLGGRGRKTKKFSSACLLHRQFRLTTAAPKRGLI